MRLPQRGSYWRNCQPLNWRFFKEGEENPGKLAARVAEVADEVEDEEAVASSHRWRVPKGMEPQLGRVKQF